MILPRPRCTVRCLEIGRVLDQIGGKRAIASGLSTLSSAVDDPDRLRYLLRLPGFPLFEMLYVSNYKREDSELEDLAGIPEFANAEIQQPLSCFFPPISALIRRNSLPTTVLIAPPLSWSISERDA
jgi:hypothetical protein